VDQFAQFAKPTFIQARCEATRTKPPISSREDPLNRYRDYIEPTSKNGLRAWHLVSKFHPGRRLFTQAFPSNIRKCYGANYHSEIPNFSDILRHERNLQTNAGSRGSVRICRTLLFRADPDMISKFESSAFSLAKPINQLTFSPKRLLPSTILSVYQTPLR